MVRETDFEKQIVVYGAGVGGKKVARILNNLGYKIKAFIDSDKAKWNSIQEGIRVVSPEWMKENDCYIIIASIGEDVIEKYLREMGMHDRIRLKEEYIMHYADAHMEELQEFAHKNISPRRKRELIIGSETGLGYWGIEQYTRTETKIFEEYDVPVSLWVGDNVILGKEELKANIVTFQYDYSLHAYWKCILDEVRYITDRLPCTVQDNWQHYTLIGAILAKRLYPEEVEIVSIVHNDITRYLKIVEYFKHEIDYVSAVSQVIVHKLKKMFSEEDKKVVYKESPIVNVSEHPKKYNTEDCKRIRLAYGGRITKGQKRTHLLLDLLDYLEQKRVFYSLDIAGDGEYANELQQELDKKGLQDHVTYIGLLRPDEMYAYWSEHDIFINLSEYEGASLSMLEAMGSGCVPIVTRVSGVAEYIIHNENGFICELDDIAGMAEYIQYLEKNRKLLPIFGEKAQKVIQGKCSSQAYVNYWGKIFQLF